VKAIVLLNLSTPPGAPDARLKRDHEPRLLEVWVG
jgi:hypothetical protein